MQDRVRHEVPDPADHPLAELAKQKLAHLATEVVLHPPPPAPRREEDRQALLDVFDSGHRMHVFPAGGKYRREAPSGAEERGVVRHGITPSPAQQAPHGTRWRT